MCIQPLHGISFVLPLTWASPYIRVRAAPPGGVPTPMQPSALLSGGLSSCRSRREDVVRVQYRRSRA